MPDPMTPEHLAEIEARANSATEGPWWLSPPELIYGKDHEGYAQVVTKANLPDAEFIAAARTDIPALLAEVRRLQAAVERVRALHQDEGPSQGFFPGDRGYGKRDHCCGTCGEYGEYGVEWPCPTVTALDGDEQ